MHLRLEVKAEMTGETLVLQIIFQQTLVWVSPHWTYCTSLVRTGGPVVGLHMI